MEETTEHPHGFQKKVYKRLSESDLASIHPKTSIHLFDEASPHKKIIASTLSPNIREEFKKTFVPILVEIFELRQMIGNKKNRKEAGLPLFKKTVPLDEMIARLELLQKEIEETKRWCEGVSLQISKGLQEAKESQDEPEKASLTAEIHSKNFIKKILKFLKRPY